jgi:hypothetical protein
MAGRSEDSKIWIVQRTPSRENLWRPFCPVMLFLIVSSVYLPGTDRTIPLLGGAGRQSRDTLLLCISQSNMKRAKHALALGRDKTALFAIARSFC